MKTETKKSNEDTAIQLGASQERLRILKIINTLEVKNMSFVEIRLLDKIFKLI